MGSVARLLPHSPSCSTTAHASGSSARSSTRTVGRCGWVDVDARRPDRVFWQSATQPVLDVGRPGTFDEHGVTPLSVVRLDDGRLRLYYAGWQRGVGVRYFLFTGAAESDDDGASFRASSEAPVLDRSDGELHVRIRRPRAGRRGRLANVVRRRQRVASDPAQTHGRATPFATCDRSDGLDWPRIGTVCLSHATTSSASDVRA